MIRDLPDGEKITEPGFYRISLARHHNQPCDGVSVTSGVLRTMERATPADVWAFHALNPDRWERPETTALRLGRAMAAFIEGGSEALAQHFAVLPEDKPRRPTAAQLAAYEAGTAKEAGTRSVEFWREVEEDSRDYLTAAEWDLLVRTGGVLASDPAAAAVMGGEPEISMAWRDPQTGIWILSRPDTVSFDGAMADYKRMATSGQPFSERIVDRRVTDFAYDMQMALAAEAFETLTGEWPASVGIVAQWSEPPHHVILREIAEEDLRIGQWRNRRALLRFAECLESGRWPGPGEHVGIYRRPDWQREQIGALMASGPLEPTEERE